METGFVKEVARHAEPAEPAEPDAKSGPGTSVIRKWTGGVILRETTLVDGLRHGPSRAYHLGVLVEEAEYRKGRRDGPYRHFDLNGRPTFSAEYRDDHLEGHVVVNDETKYEYRQDRLVGRAELRDYVHSGNPHPERFEMRVYSSGAPYYIYELRDGKRHGRCFGWYENGQPLDEGTYHQGKLEGIFTRYNPGGVRVSRVYSREGLHQGVCTFWHNNGNVDLECEYLNGVHHGVRTERHITGDLATTTEYCDGAVHGVTTEWLTDGTPASTQEYQRGMLHGISTEWRNGVVTCAREYRDDGLIRLVKAPDSQGRNYVLPDGEIDVWKACRAGTINVYVRIRVPREAGRVTPFSALCKARVEYGTVVEIVDAEGRRYPEATSFVYSGGSTTYVEGQVVRPDRFDPNPRQDCGAGLNVHLHRDHCTQWFG